MYTLKQAANKLGVSIVTLRRYIKQGKLTAHKVGKEYRIAEDDIQALLTASEPFEPEAMIRHALETNEEYRWEHQRSDAFSKVEKLLRERGDEDWAAEVSKDALIFGYRLVVQSRAEKPGHTNRGRFSPRMTGKDAQGNDASWPDPALINESLIEHAKKRAAEVTNPVTKAVYSDLIYEFSKNADRPRYGKQAAETYLQAAEIEPRDDKTHRFFNVQDYILRSLEIALALKDKALEKKTVDYALGKLERLAAVHEVRISLEIIKMLLRNTKLLDAAMLNRLATLIDVAAAYYVDHEGNEHLGRSFMQVKKLLPDVKQSQDEQRKIQRWLYDSFIREGVAKAASPGVASHFYAEALKLGGGVISPEEQADLRRRMEVANLKAEDEMQEHSFEVTIKHEEIKQYVEAVLTDDMEESLIRMALLPGMVPSLDNAKKSAQELLDKYPISQMFASSSFQDGRVVAITPGGLELSENHILQRFSEEIQMHGVFLGFLYDELKRRGLDANTLAAFLSQRDMFRNDDKQGIDPMPGINEALGLYFDGKYFSAITVLLPQIEQLLRLANRKLGFPSLTSKDNGQQQVIYMQKALENLQGILRPDLYQYFCLILWDKRGLGLRDTSAHGLLQYGSANRNQANLLVHLLITLAPFEYTEKSKPQ